MCQNAAAAVLVTLVLVTGSITVDADSAPTRGCLTSVAGIDLQSATIPSSVEGDGVRQADERSPRRRLPRAHQGVRPRREGEAEQRPLDSTRALARTPPRSTPSGAPDVCAGRSTGSPFSSRTTSARKDQPTTAGSISLARNVPKRDAFLTARLRKAGAVILGKANLAEFANWVSLMAPNG